jgi:hypothetical protein
MSGVIMFEVSRYLESPVFVIVQKTNTLDHLYEKVKGAIFPLSSYAGSQGTTLWVKDDIPVNSTIHDIFTYSSKFDEIQSIPYDDFTTLGDFMEDNPNHFERIQNTSNIHAAYKIYAVDDNSLQMMQNNEMSVFDSSKSISTTITIAAKKLKYKFNSFFACAR